MSVVLVGVGTGTSTAQASDTLSPAQIRHALRPAANVHMTPTVQLARKIQRSVRRKYTTGNLTYHGGAVMQAANNSVPIYWMPSKLQDGVTSGTPSANFISLVNRYFDDIGGSPLNQVHTQYYQTIHGPTEYIVNASHRILAVIDTSAYPAAGAGCGSSNGVNCLDDSQIRAKIVQVSAAHSLPQDLNTEYYVFLAPHESTCFSSSQCFKADNVSSSNFVFCAYHTYFTSSGGKPVIYANMPYGAYAAAPYSCTDLTSFPNDRDADIVISTTSHEQAESTTDPQLQGWYYQDLGHENGDECSYNYGTRSLDGGLANEQWNGHYYVVQQEWSNLISGCTQGMLPIAQLGTASVYEGDTGTHTVEFPVTLDFPATSTVTVHYQVSKGRTDTATAGSDFVAANGTLTFNPVFSGKTGTVMMASATINGDTTNESNETYSVTLTSASGATLGSHRVTHSTIINDDPESGLQLTASNVGIVEGDLVATVGGSNAVFFHVHLSRPVPRGQTVTVQYSVVNGTATGGSGAGAGVDFIKTSSPVTLTFTAGQSDKTVGVRVFADPNVEANETFLLKLANATHATIKSATGTGTIINDD